jgi:hypothetical protein
MRPIIPSASAILLTCMSLQAIAAEKVKDVCSAVRTSADGRVTVRGLAQFSRDAFILGDLTCPVYKSDDLRIPALIQVEVRSFASGALKDKFLADSVKASKCTFFQVIVSGQLQCRPQLRFRRSDDGDVVSGNGFGPDGLVKCKLSSGRLSAFEELMEGSGCHSDNYLPK